MCTFLLQNGALWDIRPMHYGICEMGPWRMRWHEFIPNHHAARRQMTHVSQSMSDMGLHINTIRRLILKFFHFSISRGQLIEIVTE